MVEPTGNRQNEYTKKAVKTEIQEWVEEYVYEVLEGDERFASVSGIDGDPDDDPIIPPEPPENRLVSIKFLNDAGTEYVDPRDSNGNFIAFGDVVTEKDGKVYVNVKAEIQDDRDKETVEYWKIQLDGGFVREKQEVKKFTYKNLEPNKEYTTVVRSFDKNNKGIGTSGPIRFKTKLANNSGDKPPAVTNLQGTFDGRILNVTWDYNSPPPDFTNFVVKISKSDDSNMASFNTVDTSFTIGKSELISFLQSIPSQIKVTVYAKNRRNILSDPVSILVSEGCLDEPTNVKLEAAVLGYVVSWDKLDTDAYQATAIYESDSENGEYVFVYSSSTSPVFVPSTNFTPRFIKIGHASFTDKVCELVPTTPKSVIPINPVQIDTTPPSPVTNASAVFDGTTYKLTFDKSPEEDLRDFIITLTGTSPSGSSTRTYILSASEQTQQLLQFTIDENTNFFGSPKNNIVASIVARDLTSNLSTAVENITATLVDSPPTPTGISISPGVLSYIATWNDPNYGLYSYSKIYESSTENGTYTNVANGTSPLTVLTNNGDARWVKISHVSKLGAESTISSATLVDPVNPVEIDITPPENATNLSLSTSADSADPTRTKSSITATWTASTSVDLSGYYLRIRQGTGTWAVHIADRTATSYIFNNLTPNASYTVEIATFDKVSNVTPYGLTQTITTAKDTSAPSVPTSLLLTTLPRQIVATWSTVSDIDIDKYQVQIDTANTFNTANLKTQETYSTTSSFSGLVTGTLYYVRVRGVDKSGNNGAYSSIASATVPAFVSDGVAPSSSPTPTVSSGINAIAVRWSIVSNNDPVTYEVHVSTSSTFTPSASTKVGETESTFMMVSTDGTGAKLLYSTNYYFKIIAKDYDGSASASAASAAVQVSTVGTNDIAANAITAAKIAADTITANEIASNAITANEIQAGSITAVKFNASMGNFTSSMSVGAVSGKQISIVGPAATDPGKIFSANSGALGVFQDANTGFYLDGDGRFSLKDKLSWNGTSLVVQGEVRATSGYFSGALSVNGSGGAMKIGPDAGGSGNNGLYIDANNYWYSTGNFKVGASSSAYLSWNGSLLDIKGQINATSGSFTGNVKLDGGSLYAGSIVNTTTASLTNNVATIVTEIAHPFSVGNVVTVNGSVATYNGTYTITGITANSISYAKTNANLTSAAFTGTVSSAQRLILNSSGIAGYDAAGSNKFNLTTAGLLTAKSGTIGGWTIGDSTISSSGVVLDSTNKKITFGASSTLSLGENIGGTGKHGLYIDANDYIYGDGTFSLGNGSISWNGATLSVTGSGAFSGSITASSGTITGPLQVGTNGYLYAGASATSGARVVVTKDGIAGYSSATGNPQLFILTPSSSSISGWSINSSTLEKTSDGVTIKLDSANSQITAGNLSATVGIRSAASGGVAIWAGSQSPPSTIGDYNTTPLHITNTGDVYASKFNGFAIKLSGGVVTYAVGGRGNLSYSILSLDGKDVLLGSSGAGSGGPAKIRWLDGSNVQRGTIGWEVTEEDGDSNYPQTFVIRSHGNTGSPTSSGKMLITAAGNTGTINLKAAGGVTINGETMETPSTITNRYRNAEYSPNRPNNITYGTDTASQANTNPINGDIHLRY